MNYHLIGIGGMGMSGLAQVLAHEGHNVSGSDRDGSFELEEVLKQKKVKIFKQDGSGINPKIDKVIISRAIEKDNVDLIKAFELKLSVSFRQDILKELFSIHSGIAVAGTNGKTTVVGMIALILDNAGQDMTIINGGIMNNYNNNVKIGKEPYYCIETDESEGNLSGYYPKVAVITNIGTDHMCRKELIKVYEAFAGEVKNTLVINNDSRIDINKPKTITYSINNDSDIRASDIKFFPSFSIFKIDNQEIKLPLPGLYNVYNALAAIGVSRAWGIPLENAIFGLEGFKGIKRRFEVLVESNGIRVVDDFAHNPDKIKAALNAAHIGSNRVIAIYQPHGFGPTKMFFKELVDLFSECLSDRDILFMLDIFYAGGSANKDISANDVIEAIKDKDPKVTAKYVSSRNEIIDEVCGMAQSGDTIIIMGARDNTLSKLGELIIGKIGSIKNMV